MKGQTVVSVVGRETFSLINPSLADYRQATNASIIGVRGGETNRKLFV